MGAVARGTGGRDLVLAGRGGQIRGTPLETSQVRKRGRAVDSPHSKYGIQATISEVRESSLFAILTAFISTE
jgi:hypothetical protein